MYKPLLCPKFVIQCLLLTLLVVDHVDALSTDKDQPITIEADSADIDDARGVNIYRGNVIVRQGSIRIMGDIMTVYLTEDDELDTLIMEGKPAHYQQLPDGKEILDQAEAMRMEFYELKNLVVLIGKAVFEQEDLRSSGNRIDYDTSNSKIKLQSKPTSQDKSKKSKKERVKVILKQKEAKQK